MNKKTKIATLSRLKRIVLSLRKKHRQKKIAFTNGCFDILHFGHVSYLEKAKRDNRVLIVGLNSDRSVRKLKGKGRPINPQSKRAAVLAALACVDYVTVFNGNTPREVIRALQPDILVKGADWKGKQVAGSDIVKARGGRVEFIRFVNGFSTSRLIAAIKRA